MLVIFSCKNHASVIMFGDIAQEMIRMMGHSGTVPSAILSPNIPEALEKLKSALENEKIQCLNNIETHEEDEDSEQPVSIFIRAYPLLELLNSAAEGECDVMWDTL
ncbi:hypothetical protein BOO24_01150 [Vibrio navarrensis]|uniref:DUF1840 domain-containing protein n=1 Tax=Vibrio navarrensis TaxID=29495 RepID=UPI001869EAB7|nr:DUF1840 domain-containing protein [Vibrio navarrensis]MBE3670295.1 hypothetical protein [Vibrio navarrensis]MBE4590965.1 hypothetical protein [Vibrio navarrensis]